MDYNNIRRKKKTLLKFVDNNQNEKFLQILTLFNKGLNNEKCSLYGFKIIRFFEED